MFSFAGEWKKSFGSMLSLDPEPYLALSQKCQMCNGAAARAERYSLAAGFGQNDMKPCKPAARGVVRQCLHAQPSGTSLAPASSAARIRHVPDALLTAHSDAHQAPLRKRMGTAAARLC